MECAAFLGIGTSAEVCEVVRQCCHVSVQRRHLRGFHCLRGRVFPSNRRDVIGQVRGIVVKSWCVREVVLRDFSVSRVQEVAMM